MNIEIQCLPKYQVLYNLPKDTNFIIAIGGRGSGKTYNVSQYVAVQTCINRKRAVVIRDERSIIKESILNEIWARYDSANENGVLDQFLIKNETELKEKESGKTLIYTKGFRASDNQKKANLKGASDIDIALLEEGEDIREKEKFYTFIDSLRKEGCIVIMLLNVPDVSHFIIKNYFNTEQIPDEEKIVLLKKGIQEKELDGYFKIVPKKILGFLCIQTNYEDTVDKEGKSLLPKHIIDRYESYGDPKSSLYDVHYYLTAIKGYASTGRKGQILKKVKRISLTEYMKLPFREIYGQDFGTAAPAALSGAKFDRNNVYIRQLNYLPMGVKDIGKLYCKLGFTPADKIIVDHAEPEWRKLKGFPASELTIDELRNYPALVRGFFVEPCQKGEGSIREGISLMNGLNIFAVEESTDLWNEINNWVYAVNKYGEYTNDPEPGFDHLIDTVRYMILDQRGKGGIFGM